MIPTGGSGTVNCDYPSNRNNPACTTTNSGGNTPVCGTYFFFPR